MLLLCEVQLQRLIQVTAVTVTAVKLNYILMSGVFCVELQRAVLTFMLLFTLPWRRDSGYTHFAEHFIKLRIGFI